jgi:hypothetical protein
MPRPKNPTPAKIVPDGENYAVQWYGMLLACPEHERQALLVHNAFMRWRGVGSLIAERDALRKLVKEAYLQGVLDQSHCCGLAGSKQGLERFLEKHGEH